MVNARSALQLLSLGSLGAHPAFTQACTLHEKSSPAASIVKKGAVIEGVAEFVLTRKFTGAVPVVVSFTNIWYPAAPTSLHVKVVVVETPVAPLVGKLRAGVASLLAAQELPATSQDCV